MDTREAIDELDSAARDLAARISEVVNGQPVMVAHLALLIVMQSADVWMFGNERRSNYKKMDEVISQKSEEPDADR